MHKKAKITSTRFKGIPAVLTAQGFHKGRLDCVEVSVIHCLDSIAINASSREVFHRRRLALPSSSSTLLNSSTLDSSTPLYPSLNSSTPLNSSQFPSSLNSPVKGEQDEKVDKTGKTEENKIQDKSRIEEETKTKIQILIRDAFGTFKGEVPYYSARIMSIPEVRVSGLKELDEVYEKWLIEEKGEDE